MNYWIIATWSFLSAHYLKSCLDDCSRKVASKWCERKRTIDVLDVLKEWIVINGKPKKVMRDNGKRLRPRSLNTFLSVTT